MGDETSRRFLGFVTGTLLVLSCFSIFTGHLKPIYDPAEDRKKRKAKDY